MNRIVWSICLATLMVTPLSAEARRKPAKKSAAVRPLPKKAPPPAPKPAVKEEKKEEKVEEVDAVEDVDGAANKSDAAAKGGVAAGTGGAAGDENDAALGPLDVLSRLHPAMVHLPIAWILLLFIFEWLTFAFMREELQPAGLWIGVLAILSFAPAISSGLLRADHLPQDPEALAPAIVHRNVMYGVLSLTALVVGIRAVRREQLVEGTLRWIYLSLVTAAMGLVSWGGHLGGKLVYGDDFLPF